ncbi:MAG: hypothetical protein JXR37_29125 [Kiritimatiellae bacterium]|nr:hypothetical protein [Kiritimatiellia bacterium]
MRSIRYLLGAAARNLDDCLDRAEREPVVGVSVQLDSREQVTDSLVLRRLVARYAWCFPAQLVLVEQNLGGFFAHENDRRRAREVLAANRRLARAVSRITALGVQVHGGEERFAGAAAG